MSNQRSTSPREEQRAGLPPSQVQHTQRFSEDAWKAIGQSLKLSGRELAIVRGVFEDCTELAIAANLKISPHTVHTHVERLHHKLKVADRVQLVLRVMDEFLALTVSPQSKLPPVCARWHADACPVNAARR